MLIEGECDWRKMRRKKNDWGQEEVFEQTNIKKLQNRYNLIRSRRGRRISTHKITNIK